MRNGASDASDNPSGNMTLDVVDTQYLPRNKAFSIYREAICKVFMPWSLEAKSGSDFHARIETLAVGQGSVGRLQLSPLVATRTKQDIANSQQDCFYANFLLSGEVKVEQSGLTNFLKAGDLVVHDGNRPVTLTNWDGPNYEILTFRVPKDRFSPIRNVEDRFNNVRVTRAQLLKPLSQCLELLSRDLRKCTADEVTSIFDACVSLLPIAAGCFDGGQDESATGVRANYLLQKILAFIDRNLDNTDLSPQRAADNIGISVRYIHRLFATFGTTFGSYVTARRLDYIRKDLLSHASRDQPISVIAYRWGFKDWSTFFRAFKKKFGCSPSNFRSAGMTSRILETARGTLIPGQ